MATYKLTRTAAVIRDDGALIPADPLNRDYRAFLEWRDVGKNVPGPADPLPVLPPVRDLAAELDDLRSQLGRVSLEVDTLQVAKLAPI